MATNIPGAIFAELQGDDHLPWVGDYTTIVNVIRHHCAEAVGSEDATPPTRKLATALFTDIQNSTAQLTDMGDAAWRDLLNRHDELARGLVAQFDGRFVKSTGDGCLAMFDGPSRAVRCARFLVDELAELGLVIRAGLHSGEIEPRQDDVTGLAVHIAARVMEQAIGGEVLVSQTVMALTVGSELKFEAAGIHELKGVPGEFSLSLTNQKLQ